MLSAARWMEPGWASSKAPCTLPARRARQVRSPERRAAVARVAQPRGALPRGRAPEGFSGRGACVCFGIAGAVIGTSRTSLGRDARDWGEEPGFGCVGQPGPGELVAPAWGGRRQCGHSDRHSSSPCRGAEQWGLGKSVGGV